MRKNIIAGNWKMYKTPSETREYFDKLLDRMASKETVIIFPPFLSVASAVEAVRGSSVSIGVQNMHFADEGAYTGEVSADMVRESGAKWVLIGHSERRKYFAETDETVNLKLLKALEKGLRPMVCVGEDLSEREEGKTFEVIGRQLREGLKGISGTDVAVAYEPV